MTTKILKRSFAVLLCLTAAIGAQSLDTAAAYQVQTKMVSITEKLSGVQSADSFAATKSYDDGTYYGILTRQDSTLRSVARAAPTVSYTYQSDSKYPNDKSASSQYSFPSTYAARYYDSVSGQYFSATLSQSGSPYFSGSVTATILYFIHYGYQYDPETHLTLGYMSNNPTTYYGGLSRFSDPPRAPLTYYGPPGEENLGWTIYKVEWDGALQDSTQEPWCSICMAKYGVARFEDSSTGVKNRYRKPVRVYYSRTANTQYIYQNYTGNAIVTDTVITYTGTVTLKETVGTDLSVTSLTTDKTDYKAGETVEVTAVVQNSGKTEASGFIVRLSSSPYQTLQDIKMTLAAGASKTVTYTYTLPTNLSSQIITMTVTADVKNVIAESNESNNSRTTSVNVGAPKPDIAIVDSTVTNWYTGMDVTVSATVRNRTAEPVPAVPVSLTIGGTTYTESIPVPDNGTNLAVFHITVPSDAGTYTVEVTVDPENALDETDETNNTLADSIQVVNVPDSIVANPDDATMEQYYKTHGPTDIPSTASSTYHTWQEIRLEDGRYVTEIYYARLTTVFSIAPDSRLGYDSDTLESGFGFSVACTTTITTNYDHPEKLVGAQLVWVRYPESAYGQLSAWQSVRDTLEALTGAAGYLSTTWQLTVNPFSVTSSRLHYTPLWYPDGAYTAWAQAFYAWSPVGQLYGYETDALTIDGDMYDRITTVMR